MKKTYETSDAYEQKCLDQAERTVSFLWNFQQQMRSIVKHGQTRPDGSPWTFDDLYETFIEMLVNYNIDLEEA